MVKKEKKKKKLVWILLFSPKNAVLLWASIVWFALLAAYIVTFFSRSMTACDMPVLARASRIDTDN